MMKQPKFSWLQHFSVPLCIAGFLLVISPFAYKVQDYLTKLLYATGVAKFLSYYIIPLEITGVRFILKLLGVTTNELSDYKTILLHRADSTVFATQITWSCIGWESLLCLILSLIVGIGGHYTRLSKILSIILGLIGTIVINLLRITVVCLMGFFYGAGFAVAYHNYFGAALVLLWLFIYWWLCYGLILKSKKFPS